MALGAVFAAAGVALGAFGAHALRARLPAELLTLWNTAVQYHMWHALGVIAAGLCAPLVAEGPWLRAAGAFLAAGIVLFSGSLYALALGAPRGLGAVTPVGGISLILGWLALAIALLRS